MFWSELGTWWSLLVYFLYFLGLDIWLCWFVGLLILEFVTWDFLFFFSCLALVFDLVLRRNLKTRSLGNCWSWCFFKKSSPETGLVRKGMFFPHAWPFLGRTQTWLGPELGTFEFSLQAAAPLMLNMHIHHSLKESYCNDTVDVCTNSVIPLVQDKPYVSSTKGDIYS